MAIVKGSVIRIGQPGRTAVRTTTKPLHGAITSGAQSVAVPARNTGGQLTHFGTGGKPTQPLSVHSVANNQSPSGAVQKQRFTSPLKPQRF